MTQQTAPRDIRVGVIGVGRMGADHVERISRRTKGACISVVSDYLRETAEKVVRAALLQFPQAGAVILDVAGLARPPCGKVNRLHVVGCRIEPEQRR